MDEGDGLESARTLAEIALDEARMARDEQRDALEKLRTRSLAFTTASLAVAAIAAGWKHNGGSHVLLVLAVILLVIAGGVGIVISGPWWAFRFSMSGRAVQRWTPFREDPNPPSAVADKIADDVEKNESRLSILSWAFTAQLAAGVTALCLWLVYRSP